MPRNEKKWYTVWCTEAEYVDGWIYAKDVARGLGLTVRKSYERGMVKLSIYGRGSDIGLVSNILKG